MPAQRPGSPSGMVVSSPNGIQTGGPYVSRKHRYIGKSVTRLEDRPLLTGAARFVADLNFAHQLHARVARSPHAFGSIKRIDVSAAQSAPGVVAVWTAQDLDDLPPIPFRSTAIQGLPPYRQPVLR